MLAGNLLPNGTEGVADLQASHPQLPENFNFQLLRFRGCAVRESIKLDSERLRPFTQSRVEKSHVRQVNLRVPPCVIKPCNVDDRST